jgi:hypothetical protein
VPPRPRSRILPGGRFALLALLAIVTLGVARAGRGTVRVPATVGVDLATGYARLHGAGLLVSFPHSFVLTSAGCPPLVAGTAPRALARVTRGYNVTLALASAPCGVSSPAVPRGQLPRYRLPDFSGWTLARTVGWLGRRDIAWRTIIPPLYEGAAPTLYAGFLVTGQAPRPGTTVTPGATTVAGRLTPMVVDLHLR